MGGLPAPLEAVDIWRDIWFEEAHHSTAIEGNTSFASRSRSCSVKVARSERSS
jgi:hypothetical protein